MKNKRENVNNQDRDHYKFKMAKTFCTFLRIEINLSKLASVIIFTTSGSVV